MLVNGKWSAAWHPVQAKDAKGSFVRQTSSFRHWVTPEGSPGPTGEDGFPAEAGRYHLYVALICPWASRTLIARALKRLEDVVSVTVLEPALTDQGWRFGGDAVCRPDSLNGATYLHEIYTRADPHVHRPRHGPRALGPEERDHRQQRIRRHRADAGFRLRRSGR